MKAFLSHSSKDKHTVRQIAEEMGALRCEYDEYSFDFSLNTRAIRAAMGRAQLFVLLLSANSIKANFVNEEIRAALEARAGGRVREVLIISLDSTTYQSLPAWMREINVAQHLKTAKQIARRIDAYLTELSLEAGIFQEFYLGREVQEGEIRRALARPRASVPIAIHAVGNHGIGRRTLIKKALTANAPRHYSVFLDIPIHEYDGINELYRKLYDLMEVQNPALASENLARFMAMTTEEKLSAVTHYIREMNQSDTMPLFVDEGGVLQDDGDYQSHFYPIIDRLSDLGRPAVGFVQTRMMRQSFKTRYPRSFHLRVPALSDESVYELMCLTLNDLQIDFEEDEVKRICAFTDGQPYNINFVAAYVAEEGMDLTLSDPSDIIELKTQRGSDFLRKIAFSEIESDILAILHEYRICEIEFLLITLNMAAVDITEAVRRLDDLCCIEKHERLISISPAIRDALRRDKRFFREAAWLGTVASRIVATFANYEADESIPISLIDSAIPELIRSNSNIKFVTALILPSHFLRAARDYYDRRNWKQSVTFCRKAIEIESQLTIDARIEAHRLLALSICRINPKDPEVNKLVVRLNSFSTPTAFRVALFVRGFRDRKRGDYETALGSFEQALAYRPDNFHINRELANVLCKLHRYSEAEPYARSTLQRSPDNPYIIDVLIDTLEGKISQGLTVDRRELARLNAELQDASDVAGKQFFEVREAKKLFRDRNTTDAFNRFAAIESSKSISQHVLFERGKLFVKQGNFVDTRRDIDSLRKLETGEANREADDLEIQCLIGEGRHVDAKRMIDDKCHARSEMSHRLEAELARSIAYDPSGCPPWLREWAKAFR